ncbi:unnamed protein product [Clonostachys rosea]|uniref:Xylanolytic transcriptional activator regulatory domain-containing protein n=1 Tax=Bionectria ochroleuca TaxID=29856 RepID=A0ABY6V0W2_BIOOC|nr:unnamed protein product [Clonostachys rosea]
MWHDSSSMPCMGLAKKISATSSESTAMCGQSDLPPLTELLPVVDNYFNAYNRHTPLFDQPDFMRMILEIYSSPHPREIVPWAALNLVLAISYRLLEDRSLDDPALAQSMRIVQSATTDLMAWDRDLLGLQVLLGMVILFQGTTSPQLAIVLIGSCIRLIQSMGLPSQRVFAGLPPGAALQKRRIFWIAYILDRDLALRAKAPYTQIDAETDLEFPEASEDGLGMVTSKIDGLRFNYLRARVELAHIQGKVHDLLYSKRARKLSEDQRLQNISRIDDMLRTWRESVPDGLLTADGLRRRLNDGDIQIMTNLLNRHLECIFRLHSMYSFETAWLNRVRCYLSPCVIELRDDMDGELVHCNLAPLPGEWEECVRYCRLSLELLGMGKETEHAMRIHTCCELSALIVLLVNIIENPDHELLSVDQDLIDQTRNLFEKLSEGSSENKFFLLQLAQDLDRRARGQVNRLLQANNLWFLEDMGDN